MLPYLFLCFPCYEIYFPISWISTWYQTYSPIINNHTTGQSKWNISFQTLVSRIKCWEKKKKRKEVMWTLCSPSLLHWRDFQTTPEMENPSRTGETSCTEEREVKVQAGWVSWNLKSRERGITQKKLPRNPLKSRNRLIGHFLSLPRIFVFLLFFILSLLIASS